MVGKFEGSDLSTVQEHIILLVPLVATVAIELVHLGPDNIVVLWRSLQLDLVEILCLVLLIMFVAMVYFMSQPRAATWWTTLVSSPLPPSASPSPPSWSTPGSSKASRSESQLVIFSAIDDLIKKIGLKPKDIDVLVVNYGPSEPSSFRVSMQRLRASFRLPKPIRTKPCNHAAPLLDSSKKSPTAFFSVDTNVGDVKLKASIAHVTVSHGPILPSSFSFSFLKPGFFFIDYSPEKDVKFQFMN